MRVLFHVRPSFYRYQGGDAVQILGTKDGLERLGVEVGIATEPNPIVTGYDLIHIFNPGLVSMSGTKAARAANIPVAISTIYWPMDEYFAAYRSLPAEYTKAQIPNRLAYSIDALVRYCAYSTWNIYHKNRLQRFFALADILLPNSTAEAEIIRQTLNTRVKQFPVPNGVQINQPKEVGVLPKELSNLEGIILCAGRIELRKNQHLLIKALMHTTDPLVFVGNDRVNTGYTALCRTLAAKRGNTYFVPHLDHSAMPAIYQQAKVHALPSWYETPGLASLEAAFYGASIVTTDQGGTKEYFGDDAVYCNPNDPESITRAIELALKKTPKANLRERIRRDFSWDACAQKTLDAYQEAHRATN